MNFPKFRLCRQRVGVVGLYRSGKTVFLTSLINHLQNHHPHQFRLGRGDVKLTYSGEQKPTRFPAFPYLEYRNQLVNAKEWPVKTRGVSEYCCRYYRSDWRVSRGEITLVDFPGERLADLMMAKASYDEWSDIIMAIFQNHDEYRSLAESYLNSVEGSCISEAAVVDAYRQLLLKLFLGFRPVVSPSAFLLSPDGRWLGDVPRDQCMDHCFSGLDASKQFVPLFVDARQRNPELRKIFSKRYEEYRRIISLPLSKWMRSCDALTVLIDVTALLAGGEGMYQGNRELLRNLIEQLSPGKSYFGVSVDVLSTVLSPVHGPLNSFLDLNWHEITRMAFVATKADKVHESDRQRLCDLVKEMTEGLIAAHRVRAVSLDVGYFACAAVKSTRSAPDGKLQAYIGDGDQPSAFMPSGVPEEWPKTWQHGTYHFPNMAPWIPPRRDAAPDHIELNRVADFLMQ